MIQQLQANQPQMVLSVDGVVSIYIRQYGAGNLRMGMNREDLNNSNPVNLAPGAVVDGIPQAAADGVKQYFWSGDLWLISDAAGPVMILAPAYTLYLDRSNGVKTNPSDANVALDEGGNLSTYQ